MSPAAAEERARATEQQMTDEERFGLIYSLMVFKLDPTDFSSVRDERVPAHVPQIAGSVKGVPRLGVPDLLLTDAGLGITNPTSGRKGDTATALPSAQALAATFNPKLAYDSGVILGTEARSRGFNVVLGGGMNLMCAYNRINGDYACGNDTLLNRQVKGAMGFKGFVMSDWKAVYGWEFALKGLDQHSGAQVDEKEWFVGPLREAYARGQFPKSRLSDMVRRILYAVYLVGADTWRGPQPAPDLAPHLASAVEVARQGTVLVKNDGILPIRADVKSIAVIGGFSNLGMVSGGGGSSLTDPVGGFAFTITLGGTNMLGPLRRLAVTGPAPAAELRKQFPKATILTEPGDSPAAAAALARRADVAVVFAWKTASEGHDDVDLSLPWGQRDLIEAVIAANPNTVVVLETGNPVEMPWRDRAPALVESWYSGNAGGRAIAEVLSGKVNPSGRLPVTFYASLDQTPHAEPLEDSFMMNTPSVVRYTEGAEVGYRWLARTGAVPNYPFGHGLSYTTFAYGGLEVSGGETVTAKFTVTNTGRVAGADVPQVYLIEAPGEKRMRLLGFERVELAPGVSRTVTITADPRLLARFDGAIGQ
jgi:beta-glucosidase